VNNITIKRTIGRY